MNKLSSFRELVTWQVSMELVKDVYRKTESLPKAEIYGLTSQIRRAAVSIPANIAEGYGRKHRPEYLRFLSIAAGSLAELESLLILTEQLGYLLDVAPTISDCDRLRSLLSRLAKSLDPDA